MSKSSKKTKPSPVSTPNTIGGGTLEELTTKFVEMTKNFKDKADGLINEVSDALGGSMECSVKNFLDLQESYVAGFMKISDGAMNANALLVETFEKNYSDLKSEFETAFNETQTTANEVIQKSLKDFEDSCEECRNKAPKLPESAYKDVISAISDAQRRLNTQMERQYRDILGQMERNYYATKREITLQEIREPRIPALDIDPQILEKAKARQKAPPEADPNEATAGSPEPNWDEPATQDYASEKGATRSRSDKSE